MGSRERGLRVFFPMFFCPFSLSLIVSVQVLVGLDLTTENGSQF